MDLFLRDRQIRDLKMVLEGLDPEISAICVCGNHDIGDQGREEIWHQSLRIFFLNWILLLSIWSSEQNIKIAIISKGLNFQFLLSEFFIKEFHPLSFLASNAKQLILELFTTFSQLLMLFHPSCHDIAHSSHGCQIQ